MGSLSGLDVGGSTIDSEEWVAALVLAHVAAEGSRAPLHLLKEHSVLGLWRAGASTLRQWCEARHVCQDERRGGSRAAWVPSFIAKREAVDVAGVCSAVGAAGLWFIPWSDPRYPDALRQLEHPPPGIFGWGDAQSMQAMLRAPVVTIVGTRRSTPYGRSVADLLARAFSAAGITVVSGLAHGIDAQAHRGCLSCGGQTLAVLGTGAERPYPQRHADLYRRIGRRGAVISEIPPGAPVFSWRFPQRNRLMAALGDALVIAEAGVRSGALNTAGWALDLGRPVFAVPGPILGESSRGTNRLLAEGALPCLDVHEAVQDFLSVTQRQLRERGARLPNPTRPVDGGEPAGPGWGPVLARFGDAPSFSMILLALSRGTRTVDEVALSTGLSAREVSAGLTFLEADGQVVRLGQGRYGPV